MKRKRAQSIRGASAVAVLAVAGLFCTPGCRQANFSLEAAPASAPAAQLLYPAPPGAYKEIDRFVQSLVEEEMKTTDYDGLADPDSAAAHLISKSHNDRERVRAVYRYIGETWGYDFSKIGMNNPDRGKKFQPENRGVCADIASAFVGTLRSALGPRLAEEEGDDEKVGVEYMEGLVRWEGLHTGDYCLEDPNPGMGHAWAMVSIEGKNYLVDPTAPASIKNAEGHPDEWQLENSFLIPEEYFVYIYYPTKGGSSVRWFSSMRWEANPYVLPAFVAMHMKFKSHEDCAFESGRRLSVELEAPADVAMTGRLLAPGSDIYSAPSLVEIQPGRSGGVVRLSGEIPRPGKYLFVVYGQKQGAAAPAAVYVVHASF